MDRRERIIRAVQQLTLTHRRLPSILEVAAEVGLTKQGVLHYFPSRAALDAAVVSQAVARVDHAMTAAADAEDGSPAATYLRLSSPDDGDRAAVMVLAAALRGGTDALSPEITRTAASWESLIAAELGDPVLAEIVRLVGDGLFGEALVTGVPTSTDRVEELLAHLTGRGEAGAG